MKKMVVLSLLVLSFPLTALADTSESIPAETVDSSQEQVIVSSSIPEETGIEDETSIVPTETQASTEETSESQKSITDGTTTTSETRGNESFTVESEQGEESLTSGTIEKKDVAVAYQQEAPKAVVPQNSKEISTTIRRSKVELEKELITDWTAKKIRENLGFPGYELIGQEELNSYTDQELTNTFKLFTRYNFDICGTDLGFYVHMLRMVYKDKVISWSDAEKALAFNPNEYTSTDGLIQNIDQLQTYLRTLYSDHGLFIPLRHFTNEELIYILNELNKDENLGYPNGLFSSIVHRLYNYPKVDLPVRNATLKISSNKNIATTANSITSNNITFSNTANVTKQGVLGYNTTQKEYPKTGESVNLPLTSVGITIFSITCLTVLKRRSRL